MYGRHATECTRRCTLLLFGYSFVASAGGFLLPASPDLHPVHSPGRPNRFLARTAVSGDKEVSGFVFRSPSFLAAQKTSSTPAIANPYQAHTLVYEGMDRFQNGYVGESIELFNQAEAIRPSIAPYLWQRGLSYYYDDRFLDASRQFRLDVMVNPLDVEEIVWDIASQFRARPEGPIQMMSLPMGQSDRRRIMAAVYSLFRGDGTERDLAMAGHSSGRPSDEFYALFYLGLYCEAKGETTKASQYMRQAAQSDYATSSGRNDYMTSVAQVHCKLRGWIV